MIRKNIKKIKKIFLGEYSTDVAFRYLPVKDLIKKFKMSTDKILEVGSGDDGITTYYKIPIVGLDLAFSQNKNNSLVKRVLYDGSPFPFSDDKFNLTLSVDCLEHIKPDQRKIAIKEIVRVTDRDLVLVFPTGEKSFQSDKKLAKYFKKINGWQDHFFTEHLENGLPDVSDIKKALAEAAFFCQKDIAFQEEKKMLNLKLRENYMRYKISKNILLNILYYSCLILLPLRNYLNFGDCYRTLLYVRINKKHV